MTTKEIKQFAILEDRIRQMEELFKQLDPYLLKINTSEGPREITFITLKPKGLIALPDPVPPPLSAMGGVRPDILDSRIVLPGE